METAGPSCWTQLLDRLCRLWPLCHVSDKTAMSSVNVEDSHQGNQGCKCSLGINAQQIFPLNQDVKVEAGGTDSTCTDTAERQQRDITHFILFVWMLCVLVLHNVHLSLNIYHFINCYDLTMPLTVSGCSAWRVTGG